MSRSLRAARCSCSSSSPTGRPARRSRRPSSIPSFEQSGGYGFVWPRDLGVRRPQLPRRRPRRPRASRRSAGSPASRRRRGSGCSATGRTGRSRPAGASTSSTRPGWSSSRTRPPGASCRTRRSTASCGRRRGRPRTSSCGFMDPETGLPLPSVDLWEQTDGQHSYSAAATYGGLVAAAAMAATPRARARGALPSGGRARARGDRGASLERGARPLPALALGRAAATSSATMPPASSIGRLRYPTKSVRSVDREDARVDSSLLGLALAVPRRRSRLAADARDARGRRARAPARRAAACSGTRTTTTRAGTRG